MYDKTTIQQFKEHAIAVWPDEACGYVLQVGDAQEYFPCENVSTEPHNEVKVPAAVQLLARERGEILAVLHSHPNGQLYPSAADMETQQNFAIPFGISTVTPDSCSDPVYFGDQVPIAPYLGRVFVHGAADCWKLFTDWYWQELKVKLPDAPRDHNWWKEDKNLYMDGFAENGFRLLADKEKPQYGDGCMMRLWSPVPNHAAVYIGNGLLLHHLAHTLSCREPVNDYKEKIVGWFRHSSQEKTDEA